MHSFLTKYKPDSQEQRSKEEAIPQWTGPPRIAEDEDVVMMMEKNKNKITNPVDKMYLAVKGKIQKQTSVGPQSVHWLRHMD